eukprot:m.279023 g.279023  ORF g.279023 m.279023 type:complete len:364 (-) comp15739_c4_seq4:2754-3845(-)
MSAGPKSPIRSAWVIAVCIICYTFTLAFGPAPTVSSNIVRHQGTDKEHLVLNELDDCVDLWTRTPQTSTVCIKRQHLTALFGGQEGHAHGLNTMFVNESGSRIDVSGTAGDIDIDWAAIHAKCERPSVLWDAPLDGGLTAGLATEAVSLISSIAPNVTLHFPEHMNVDTDFVDELPYQHQRLLKRIKAQSYAPSRPPPAIYVSQWAPGSLFRTKLDQARSPSEAMFIVSRAMYEATRVPTDWIPNFSLIHEYWVPSEWNRRVLTKEYGLDNERVHVVEEGLDAQNHFNPHLFSKSKARSKVPSLSSPQSFKRTTAVTSSCLIQSTLSAPQVDTHSTTLCSSHLCCLEGLFGCKGGRVYLFVDV